MTKMRIVALVVLVSGVCCGVSAMAGEGGDEAPGKREHGKDNAERFKAADTDGSGGLSLDEFTTMHAKRRAMMKEKLGDRYDAERAAKRPSAEEVFKKMDTSEDGELTQAEMRKAHEKRMRRMHQKRQKVEKDDDDDDDDDDD